MKETKPTITASPLIAPETLALLEALTTRTDKWCAEMEKRRAKEEAEREREMVERIRKEVEEKYKRFLQ